MHFAPHLSLWSRSPFRSVLVRLPLRVTRQVTKGVIFSIEGEGTARLMLFALFGLLLLREFLKKQLLSFHRQFVQTKMKKWRMLDKSLDLRSSM